MAVLQQIWLYEIIGCMLLMCQNPQCRYMEHGLNIIIFFVQKHIAGLVMCSNPGLVRDRSLGAPASVKLAYVGNLMWVTQYLVSNKFVLVQRSFISGWATLMKNVRIRCKYHKSQYIKSNQKRQLCVAYQYGKDRAKCSRLSWFSTT